MAVVQAQAGTPLAGTNCAASATGPASAQGKISGRGATLPLYAVTAFMNAYSQAVCGPVSSDGATNAYTPPAGTGEPTGDPTNPSNPIDAFSGASPQPTYNADGMVAYNYPAAQDKSATGSGQGRVGISCRTDAFTGSDIPYTNADFANIDGAPGAQAGGIGSCLKAGYVSPFQSSGVSTDPAGKMMAYPVVGGAIAFAVNLPAACANAGGGFKFSTADINAVMNGTQGNWGNIDLANDPNLIPGAPCNAPNVTRVVRKDSSGTTQNLFNYFANPANPDTAATLCGSSTSTDTGGNSLPTAHWGDLKNEIIASAAFNPSGNRSENNVWPTGTGSGGTCNALATGSGSGGPSLLHALVGISGGIGYADVSDVVHDPGDAGTLVIPTVQASDGTTFAAPSNSDGSANCTFSGATLTGVTADNLMGINGEWALDAAGGNHTDVSYDHQGSAYPVCALTWEMVFQGDNGNGKPATSGNQGFFSSPASLNPATPAPSTTTADLPIGTTSPTTLNVTATSVALHTGQNVTIGTQAFTLTADAAAGSTSLSVSFTPTPTTVDFPSGSTVTLPAFIDPANGAITSLPVAPTNTQLFTGQVVTVASGGSTQNWTLSAGAAKGATSIPVASQTPAFIMPKGSAVATQTYNLASVPAGTPTSGTFIVRAGGALQAGSYTGISGTSLTGVSGISGLVAASTASVELPNGTGGPEPELNANQRRTLYSYMSYVLSDVGQSNAPGSGFAQLPVPWISLLRNAFQTDY